MTDEVVVRFHREDGLKPKSAAPPNDPASAAASRRRAVRCNEMLCGATDYSRTDENGREAKDPREDKPQDCGPATPRMPCVFAKPHDPLEEVRSVGQEITQEEEKAPELDVEADIARERPRAKRPLVRMRRDEQQRKLR